MSNSPMRNLAAVMRQNGLIRFIEHFQALYPTSHLKDLVVDRIGPNRRMEVCGREVVNFGSDSFLGLDQDPRVMEAVRRGLDKWGTTSFLLRLHAELDDRPTAWVDPRSLGLSRQIQPETASPLRRRATSPLPRDPASHADPQAVC